MSVIRDVAAADARNAEIGLLLAMLNGQAVLLQLARERMKAA